MASLVQIVLDLYFVINVSIILNTYTWYTIYMVDYRLQIAFDEEAAHVKQVFSGGKGKD